MFLLRADFNDNDNAKLDVSVLVTGTDGVQRIFFGMWLPFSRQPKPYPAPGRNRNIYIYY